MYEIKVLNDNDFFDVAGSDPRYSYVDQTNLGFADREKGVAYVRQTGIHELNKYLISHELEELEQDESTHEDPNGIRHKKFFKSLLSSLNPLNIAKPIFSLFGRIAEFPFRAASVGPTQALSDIFGIGGGSQYPQSTVFSSSGQQQQAPSSGGYFPESNVFSSSGGYGGPLSLFSGTGGYTPQTVPQAAQGSYVPGGIGANQDEDVPEYIKQQKFGRLQF